MTAVLSEPANIAAALYASYQAQPQATAIILAQKPDRKGHLSYTHYSFETLVKETEVLAAGLKNRGIVRGMRTVLMVPPSLEFFALMFAMLKSGIVPVLIDPGMGLDNLKTCLQEAEPVAFVGVTKAHMARKILGWGKDTVKINLTVGPKLFWGGSTLNDLRRFGQKSPLSGVADTRPEDLAAILFTSGSTGVPKGVVYQHRQFLAQIERIRETYQVQPGEVDLATFPPFALFDPALGMTSVIPWMDPTKPALVNPEYIFDAIERFQVTHMFGSPALLNRISRAGQAKQIRLPSLRRVLSAGAPVPWQTLERMQSLLTADAQIYTPYGATECLPVASISSREILSETQLLTREGKGVCIGKAVNGVEVVIIPITDTPISEWDDSLALPVGELGEIVVKGDNVTTAYFNRQASTDLAKIVDSDGHIRHRMGDLGYCDEQGRIWFCGRKSHRVITPEGTLYTLPCEAIFNTHPAVYRTALVGVGEPGQLQPVICVELEKNPTQAVAQIILELQDLAQKYAHTRSIRQFLIHPALPVDIRHNSKIFREKLAPWASEKLAKGTLK
ncbi:MAG: fatty acid CoA ligase family protein [Candidatus Sericytochromatia bacterium]